MSREWVSVRDFGAKGDGASMDGPSIQAAVDRAGAAGGGLVVLPPGGYVSGSIFLRDGVHLRLEAGASLLGSRNPADYPLVEGRWEGRTRPVHASLVHARGVRRAGVCGPGLIDGRGEEWWRLFRGGELAHPRPRLLAFEECEDVLLEGFLAMNSPSWTINPVRSRGVRIQGVSVRNPPDSPNTDGINPDSCSRVVITGCFVSVGDDCIAVKAGVETEAEGLSAPCEDIIVSDCVLERGHGGVVIGSETSGGIRNVTVSNCVFRGTDRGIRLKSRRGRGGGVERVRVSGIVMEGVLCPFTLNSHYGCGAWGDPRVSDRGARPVDRGTPRFRDISLSGVTAVGVTLAAAWIDGLAELPAERVSLSDFTAEMAEGAAASPPEMAEGLPSLARAGIRALNVSGLRLRDCAIRGQDGPAVRLEGCGDAVLEGCGAPSGIERR